MNHLTDRLNKELVQVCLLGELVSASHLINAGADPLYDSGHPLLSACMGSQSSIVNLLLMTPSYGYSDEKTKPFIENAYKYTLGKDERSPDQSTKDIITTLKTHYEYHFQSKITI